MNRISYWFIMILAGLLGTASLVYAGELEDRIDDSRMVLEEVMKIPEKGIPSNLLMNAKAILIFPRVLKGAFMVGGKFGKGVLSSRDEDTGTWSPPAFFSIGGGSFGFQAGVQAIDLILLVMNQRGLDGLLKSKVTLGGDIAVAAGPVGRKATAKTDVLLKTEILSYSRSKGLFAGVSLNGSVVLADKDANRALYGKEVSAKEIVIDRKVTSPPIGKQLIATLKQFSHQE